ncbi:MAG: 3-hydroxyacyl-CoA dehydrogenase family protein [Pseudomonadota bacterium]
MKLEDIDHIGILGAGLMGPGIAQAFSSAGYRVNIFDLDSAALDTAKNRIASNFIPFIDLNLASPEDRERCLENITVSTSLKNLCDGPQVLIEAISEELEVKRSAYGEIEKVTPSNTILTSNTSALSITSISENLQHKARFLGTHFWNPPHIIPCVEVIKGDFTEERVFETVYFLMEKIKKVPVRVLKDVPGFLGNRLQHAMWREAISLQEKNIASVEDIDKVVKYGFGVRMPFIGPLETADLAGLALTYDIHKYLFPYLESSPEPSPALKELVFAGATGVKAGRGFYDWTPEKIRQLIQQRDTFLLRIIREIIAEAEQG